MTEHTRQAGQYTVSGLRTRFFPKNRIGQGLISLAPWLDLVFIAIFFVLLGNKFILQPGFIIELPRAPFAEGSKSGLMAVIRSIDTRDPSGREEIIFFNDERFVVRRSDEMKRFHKALAAQAAKTPEETLVLLADDHVRHGTMMRIKEMARETRIRFVNLATQQAQ